MRPSRVTLVAIALAAATARAEPAIVVAPCAAPDELDRRLAVEGIATARAIRVEAAPRPDGWQATIALSGAPPRSLHGATCREVVEAATVVVLLALDVAPATPATFVAPPPGPAPAPTREWPVGVLVRGSVLLERGALPKATAGEALDLGAERGGWSLRLGGTLLHATTTVAAARTVRTDLEAARVAGCRRLGALALCVGSEVGRFEVVAPAQMRTGSGRWWAMSGEVGADLSMTRRLKGFLSVSGHIALARSRVVFADGDLVYRPDRLSLRTALGLELIFR